MHTSLRYLQEEMPSNEQTSSECQHEQCSLGRACLHAVELPVHCITVQTDSDE